MARRSMGVADIKEILVQWDAGEGVSRIARSLGYTRPTVRKYIRAAQQVGLRRGGRQYGERPPGVGVGFQILPSLEQPHTGATVGREEDKDPKALACYGLLVRLKEGEKSERTRLD